MTKQELTQLLDDKLGGVATAIAAIEARLATVEAKMVTGADVIEIRGSLGKLEKQLMTFGGQLSKIESRLQKRFDELFDYLDRDLMENRKRIKALSERLDDQENRLRGLQVAVG